MKSRDRIAAAAWVVVRDAQTAEDVFQNVALKAITKEVSFDAEGAVLSKRSKKLQALARNKVDDRTDTSPLFFYCIKEDS